MSDIGKQLGDKLNEIESIFNSPGEIFYGEISDDGVVSQEVCDASGHFEWLISTLRVEREEKERLELALNRIANIRLPNKEKDLERVREIARAALGGDRE